VRNDGYSWISTFVNRFLVDLYISCNSADEEEEVGMKKEMVRNEVCYMWKLYFHVGESLS
jgi:hypothetical protein